MWLLAHSEGYMLCFCCLNLPMRLLPFCSVSLQRGIIRASTDTLLCLRGAVITPRVPLGEPGPRTTPVLLSLLWHFHQAAVWHFCNFNYTAYRKLENCNTTLAEFSRVWCSWESQRIGLSLLVQTRQSFPPNVWRSLCRFLLSEFHSHMNILVFVGAAVCQLLCAYRN